LDTVNAADQDRRKRLQLRVTKIGANPGGWCARESTIELMENVFGANRRATGQRGASPAATTAGVKVSLLKTGENSPGNMPHG